MSRTKGNAAVFIIIILTLIASGLFYFKNKTHTLSPQKAGEKAIAYINKNMLGKGMSSSLMNVKEENGMYKFHFKLGEREFDSYISKDGKLLFPTAINLEEKKTAAPSKSKAAKVSCKDVKKSKKPLLEAFVVSKCPFGLQMQRILSKVVEKIPSLKENIKVEYIGSINQGKVVSMHGEEEAVENERQICLREEQPQAYWPYITCHIKKGEANECFQKAGVNRAKLNSCLKKKVLQYAKKDFETAKKYQAGGSPTLILNGKVVDENGFANGENLTMRSAQMVKKLLCCGFEKEPAFCSTELSKEQAATSFSENYSQSSNSSSSKSNSSAGGCQ